MLPPDASPDELGRRFDELRPRLKWMVELRMDERLRARVSASDVLQDAFVELLRRRSEHDDEQDLPWHLWVRFLTEQKLQELHRRHLGTLKRDAGREAQDRRTHVSEVSTWNLSRALIDGRPTPPSQAAGEEARTAVHRAIHEMGGVEREVIALRHFERLSNADAAHVLGLSEASCSRRYTSALRQLRGALGDFGQSKER